MLEVDPALYRDKLERFNATDNYRRDLDRVHAVLGARPFSSLLDVGCGTGTFVREARARYPHARVDGLDRHDFGAPGCLVQDITADAAGAPGPYEVITMIHSINHVADLGAALGNVARRLCPGGWLVTVSPDATYAALLLALQAHELVPRAGGDATAVAYRSHREIAAAAAACSLHPVRREGYGVTMDVRLRGQSWSVDERELSLFVRREGPP